MGLGDRSAMACCRLPQTSPQLQNGGWRAEPPSSQDGCDAASGSQSWVQALPRSRLIGTVRMTACSGVAREAGRDGSRLLLPAGPQGVLQGMPASRTTSHEGGLLLPDSPLFREELRAFRRRFPGSWLAECGLPSVGADTDGSKSQFSSVAQSCLTLRHHGLQHARPLHHQLPESTQTHVH